MLNFSDVCLPLSRETTFGPFSFTFERNSLYYLKGDERVLKALLKLCKRSVIPSSGTLTYKGEKLNVYSDLNRNYEDLIYATGSHYLDNLSIIDNYICELFPIYKRRDVALDVVEKYLESMPYGIDPTTKFGDLDDNIKSLIELYPVNFFDYEVVLLKKPLGKCDKRIMETYLRMLDEIRKTKIVLVFGETELLDEVEKLGGYSSRLLQIDLIGEVIDDEE